MTFARKFPVGRFDFGLRRIRLNAQNSVVVNHCASLNSGKPAMDAWASLRTPRHSALKVYHRAQEICGCFAATKMAILTKGGAKGEPGKYLERHSRGRGRITKATRTLWLVALRQYNHHAIARPLENLNKSERAVQTTPGSVNSRGHPCLLQIGRAACR